MPRVRTVLFSCLVVLTSFVAAGAQDFESLSMPQQVSKLIKSGGLGGPLDPTSSDYTAEGNASMHSAMSAWNSHDWPTAVQRLQSHVMNYPNDPWTGEAMLHLGCHAFYGKDYLSSERYFEAVAKLNPGQAVAVKALTRVGPAYFLEGRAEDATKAFVAVLRETQTWDDRTYARSWLMKIDMAKREWLETGKYSECGRDSLRKVFEVFGETEAAKAISGVRVPTFAGFTMEEVRGLSEKNGRKCWGAKIAPSRLTEMPLPFIARYGSNHFVTVTGISGGKVVYYDPFGGDKVAALEDFGKVFYGEVLVFSDPTPLEVTFLTRDQMAAIRGGCCGERLAGSDGCPAPGEHNVCCCPKKSSNDDDDDKKPPPQPTPNPETPKDPPPLKCRI